MAATDLGSIHVEPWHTRPRTPESPPARISERPGKGIHGERFSEIDWNTRHAAKIVITKSADDDEPEPTSFNEAMEHPTCGKQWEQSIQEEYDAHIKNGTWELVTLPDIRQTVSCK